MSTIQFGVIHDSLELCNNLEYKDGVRMYNFTLLRVIELFVNHGEGISTFIRTIDDNNYLHFLYNNNTSTSIFNNNIQDKSYEQIMVMIIPRQCESYMIPSIIDIQNDDTIHHKLLHLFTQQTEKSRLSIDTNYFSQQHVTLKTDLKETDDNFEFIVCNLPYIVKGIKFGVHKLTRLKPVQYAGEYVFQIETKSAFYNGYWVTNVFHNSDYLDNYPGIPLV